MASPRPPSFEELLHRVPEKKRYRLDWKLENERHLAEIARQVTDWKVVLPFLIPWGAMQTKEAILENNQTVERRKLVTSRQII